MRHIEHIDCWKVSVQLLGEMANTPDLWALWFTFSLLFVQSSAWTYSGAEGKFLKNRFEEMLITSK